ncbi:unnamed protein product [Meganyctiphanes norvegica]|uniref:Uncharacterized protein n=1 Tax=Meganyctiphanes norvegica TaxID=48144 RepID=A0AAV2PVM4_MEGNR
MTVNCAVVVVILLQMTLFLLASPVVILSTTLTSVNKPDKVNEDLQPEDLINQQVQALRDHCSRPQKELLKIYHVLSDNYHGLLAANYSDLRDGNHELFSSLFLVERCNSRCRYADGLTCKALVDKNVERELYFQDKDGKYHTLRVNEHTECQCMQV